MSEEVLIRPNKAQAVAAVAWGLAGALASAAMALLEPNLLEEGFALHVAQRLTAGEHLYRDVVFYSGPLPFELLGGLFRLLGEEIAVARGAVAVMHGVATAMVFATARRAGAGALSHAAAAAFAATPTLLFPLYSIYFHTTFAVHLTVMAVFAASRAPASAGWALATGFLVAGVALSKQSIGALLAIGLLGVVFTCSPVRLRWHRSGALAAGGLGAALLTLLFYGVRGDLEPLFQCIVLLPLTLGETFGAPYINFWPIGSLTPDVNANLIFYLPKLWHLFVPPFTWPSSGIIAITQLLFAVPVLALALTALGRVRQRSLSTATWATTVGLAALLSNCFPRADWGHLAAVLPVAVAQILILWGAALGRARGGDGRVIAVAVTLLFLGSGGWVGARLHAMSKPPVLGPRVPLRLVGEAVDTIAPAVSYLREHVEPGEPIFVARAEPLIYFATDTRNPTPFEGVVPAMREEQQERIIAGLGSVRYVVMSDVDQSFMTFYADELPLVQSYIERHFQRPGDWRGDLSPVQVYERGPDRGPTLVDLVEIWKQGEAWIRSEEGDEEPWEEGLPRLATRHNRRPVALRLGPGGGGMNLEFEVPPGARFEADVGIRALNSKWGLIEQSRWLEFSVSIDDGSGRWERILAVPSGRLPARRWQPVEADLSRFAGRRVTLRLEAVPERALPGHDVTWWGSPRITGPVGRAAGEPQR